MRLRAGFEIPRPAAEVWDELTADAALHWCRILQEVRWTSPRPFGVGTTREVKALWGANKLREHYFLWEEGRRHSFYVGRIERAPLQEPRRGLPGRAARRRRLPLHLDDRGRPERGRPRRRAGEPRDPEDALHRHRAALRPDAR